MKRGVKTNKRHSKKFLEFYDILAPKVYRHILFRVNSKELAEDITSQTFLKTWQYLVETAKPIKDFRAFIYRVCNNLIIDYYRHRAKEPVLLEHDELKKIIEPEEISDTTYEENLKKILKALNKLNDEQKNILIWRYLDGLSIKEIAKITNKSRNNIYVIIHRALKNLKNYVAKNKEN